MNLKQANDPKNWESESEKPTAVFVDGPEAFASRFTDYEEIPIWTVCVTDDYGDPVGKVYECRSYDRAVSLGEKMSRDRGLELVNEASPRF